MNISVFLSYVHPPTLHTFNIFRLAQVRVIVTLVQLLNEKMPLVFCLDVTISIRSTIQKCIAIFSKFSSLKCTVVTEKRVKVPKKNKNVIFFWNIPKVYKLILKMGVYYRNPFWLPPHIFFCFLGCPIAMHTRILYKCTKKTYEQGKKREGGKEGETRKVKKRPHQETFFLLLLLVLTNEHTLKTLLWFITHLGIYVCI